MGKIKRIDYKYVLKYAFLLMMCAVLGLAEVDNISPFLFAFFFAGVFVGLDEKLLGGFTILAGLLLKTSLENFLIAVTVVAVGIIEKYIFRFCKKKIKLWAIFLGYLLSLVTYIYYNYGELKNLFSYIVLGLICLWVMITVLQVLLLRKNCFKLTLDESVCFLFFLALLGLGMSGIKVWRFEVFRLLSILAIYFLVSTNSKSLAYSVVLSFSLGVAIAQSSLEVVAEMMILCLACGIFVQDKSKSIIVLFLSEILIQVYFFSRGMEVYLALVPLLFASIIYFVTPQKVLNNCSNFVYVKKSELTSRNLINTTRKNIRKRMSELSNIFLEMKQIHLNMLKKDLTKNELVSMLMREIMGSCCRDCLEKTRCTRTLGTDNPSNLEYLLEIAVSKGKVTLLDLPEGLSNRCVKVNLLISLINRITDEYKQYKNMITDINNVKILLADQMGGVSRLLLDVGAEIDNNVTFDIARENKIISRLLSQNIECQEVLLYTEKKDDISAELVIKKSLDKQELIETVVSEILKTKMKITKVVPVENSDFNSISLKKECKFDCVFGLASCNKSGSEESGDCHSIIRLGMSKFLLALCDGMGSGKSAHNMSAMTLGLIENFYKVGFEHDIIMESVNKLLAINNQECYSTLDVCLMDLNNGTADFIKVGAPFGLIKREGGVEIVEGGALPMGALENITPACLKTVITAKDIIIMATDGITDAFVTQENLKEFVSHLVTNNPQVMAETILNQALSLNEMSAKDDMTVLVARTYLKN